MVYSPPPPTHGTMRELSLENMAHMGLNTDCNLRAPGIFNSLPVVGEVSAEVFQFPSFSRMLLPREGFEEEGFHFLPGILFLWLPRVSLLNHPGAGLPGCASQGGSGSG